MNEKFVIDVEQEIKNCDIAILELQHRIEVERGKKEAIYSILSHYKKTSFKMTTILDVVTYIEDDASLDECSEISKSLSKRLESLVRNPLKEKPPKKCLRI